MDPNTGLCVKCGSEMYNNATKNAERVAQGLKPMPLYKCKNEACANVVWPGPAKKAANGAYPVSSYSRQPSFGKATEQIPHPPARDYAAEAEGKTRCLFAVEAFKQGRKLDTETVTEIREWVDFVMTGKLDPETDL